MGMINTVGVVLHPGRDCNSAMFELLAWASGRKVTVLAVEDEASRVPGRVEAVAPAELASRSDLMVSLGGDGTMLRAMRMSCGPKPPVLGVNVGKLGFLAEIDPPEMAEALCAIDEHRFTTEPAPRCGPSSRSGDRRVQRRGPGPHPRPQLLRGGRAHRGIAPVRALRGGRGDRGHADRVHRLRLLRGRPARLPHGRGPAGHPGRPALGVQPGAVPGQRRRSSSSPCCRPAASWPWRRTASWSATCSPGDAVELSTVPDAANVVRLGKTTFYQRAQRKLRLTGSAEAD